MLPQENKPVCTMMTAHVAHFTAYYLSGNMLGSNDKEQHVPCEPTCGEKKTRFYLPSMRLLRSLLIWLFNPMQLGLASLDIRHRNLPLFGFDYLAFFQ